MEVKSTDLQRAAELLQREYMESTGLGTYDLSTAGAIFDEGADSALCPGCGATFLPTSSSCPECGLSLGR